MVNNIYQKEWYLLFYKLQNDKLDCGISTIQTLYKYFYDDWLDISVIKQDANFTKEGLSLFEFKRLCSKFNIEIKTYQVKFEQLIEANVETPFVALIKNDSFFHYICVEKITNKNNIIYIDPFLGRKKISFEEFKKIFSDIYIECKKSKSIKKIEIVNENVIDLFTLSFRKYQIFLSLISIFIIILSFIGSFYIKIILDQIAPYKQIKELIIVSILFIGILISKILITIGCEIINQKIETKYQIMYLNKYIDKLSTVAYVKINHYDETMHLKKIELLMKICSYKTKIFSLICSQIFCLIFSTIFLIILNVKLFLIAIVISIISFIVTKFFQPKFKNNENNLISHLYKFKKQYFCLLNTLEQFKVSSYQNKIKNNLNKKLNDFIGVQINCSKLSFKYMLTNEIIKLLSPFVIIIVSIIDIWNLNLSVGQIFLYISIFNFFTNPFNALLFLFVEYPIIKHHIQELNSFFNLEDENKLSLKNEITKIKSIKVHNLEFKYLQEQNNILKIDNLILAKHNRIKGKNGSGKSTLAKIISTLIVSNNISYNENTIDYYELSSIRKSICYISNNEYISNGTIFEYIQIDESNSNYLLEKFDKYKLLDLFKTMNLDLYQNIEDGGKNISLGQKQFISLMKIFSKDFSLIILDEAFENLDKNMIKKLMKILKEELENKMTIEISHQDNYLFNGKEINCDSFK